MHDNEYTFVILKPDSIERGLVGKIIDRFENRNLRISYLVMRHKTPAWAQLHYAHLNDKPFFGDLMEFMSSAPLIGLILTGPNVVQVVRNLIGPTDPLQAPPGTIRGDFGYWPARFNCVHAADSFPQAQVEADWFNDPNTDQ